MAADKDRVLCYLGPTLPLSRAITIIPDAMFRRPAKQGDILSDLFELNPTHILLIDGVFRDNLSVWTKEIVYALQFPGVKAIYGASSMGALRASECDFIGMIGVGAIYEAYRDSVTEDESEVSLQYACREGSEGPIYYPQTVPLIDIRFGTRQYQKTFKDSPIAIEALRFFEQVQKVHYMDRTTALCEQFWGDNFTNVPFPFVPQKERDAIQLLSTFHDLKPSPKTKPTPEHLSNTFQALYDRDRRITVEGTRIPQQHVDSYVLLHNPEYERICWDAANQELVLILCDLLSVQVSIEEVERESNRFQQRCGVHSEQDFEVMLRANAWTTPDFNRLMVQNARIHKLQHALSVSKMSKRNTRSILDYLRTHQAFDYWANLAAQTERDIQRAGVEDWESLSVEIPVWRKLQEHMNSEGLEQRCSNEEYLLETGFINQGELAMALARLSALKNED